MVQNGIKYEGRRIVPQLRRAGYDLTYREFSGPHTVPGEIVDEATRWFIGEESRTGA